MTKKTRLCIKKLSKIKLKENFNYILFRKVEL